MTSELSSQSLTSRLTPEIDTLDITDPRDATTVFQYLVREMEHRSIPEAINAYLEKEPGRKAYRMQNLATIAEKFGESAAEFCFMVLDITQKEKL